MQKRGLLIVLVIGCGDPTPSDSSASSAAPKTSSSGSSVESVLAAFSPSKAPSAPPGVSSPMPSASAPALAWPQAADPASYSAALLPVAPDGGISQAAWEQTFGPHSWPLTVPGGVLKCFGAKPTEWSVALDLADGRRIPLDRYCAKDPTCARAKLVEADGLRRALPAGVSGAPDGERMGVGSLATAAKQRCAGRP